MRKHAHLLGALAGTVLLAAAGLSCPPALAEAFTVRDGAAEQLQSRRFEAERGRLLRACLAVLQDIKFQVTESALEPGLLVADFPGPVRHTLTVSLHAVAGSERGYRVRLSVATGASATPFGGARRPDYADFYQDFFTHLDRELTAAGQYR